MVATHFFARTTRGTMILCSCTLLLLGGHGCAGDASSKSGNLEETDYVKSFNRDVSAQDCYNEEEVDLLLGIYTDTFVSFSENQDLVLSSDADGGLAATIAVVLMGTSSDAVSQINFSVTIEDETVGAVSHNHFEGFCTPELNWLIPQLGLGFNPGTSLFDLTDQTATLNVDLLFTDDSTKAFQAQVVFTP